LPQTRWAKAKAAETAIAISEALRAARVPKGPPLIRVQVEAAVTEANVASRRSPPAAHTQEEKVAMAVKPRARARGKARARAATVTR
jgi:hypothetical protein